MEKLMVTYPLFIKDITGNLEVEEIAHLYAGWKVGLCNMT